MEEEGKNLRIYSWIFIFLGFFDIISIVIDYLAGDFNVDTELMGVSQIAFVIAMVITIIVFAIVVSIKLFLGIRGLRQVQGKTKGKSHIVIAKIGFVIFAIALIGTIFSLTKNTSEIKSLLSNVIAILLLYEYIKDATTLLKRNKEVNINTKIVK